MRKGERRFDPVTTGMTPVHDRAHHIVYEKDTGSVEYLLPKQGAEGERAMFHAAGTLRRQYPDRQYGLAFLRRGEKGRLFTYGQPHEFEHGRGDLTHQDNLQHEIPEEVTKEAMRKIGEAIVARQKQERDASERVVAEAFPGRYVRLSPLFEPYDQTRKEVIMTIISNPSPFSKEVFQEHMLATLRKHDYDIVKVTKNLDSDNGFPHATPQSLYRFYEMFEEHADNQMVLLDTEHLIDAIHHGRAIAEDAGVSIEDVFLRDYYYGALIRSLFTPEEFREYVQSKLQQLLGRNSLGFLTRTIEQMAIINNNLGWMQDFLETDGPWNDAMILEKQKQLYEGYKALFDEYYNRYFGPVAVSRT